MNLRRSPRPNELSLRTRALTSLRTPPGSELLHGPEPPCGRLPDPSSSTDPSLPADASHCLAVSLFLFLLLAPRPNAMVSSSPLHEAAGAGGDGPVGRRWTERDEVRLLRSALEIAEEAAEAFDPSVPLFGRIARALQGSSFTDEEILAKIRELRRSYEAKRYKIRVGAAVGAFNTASFEISNRIWGAGAVTKKSKNKKNKKKTEEDVDDESKTRKHASFAARISKSAHLGSGSHCLVVSISLLVLLLVACFLFSRSRPVICVSAYDSIVRNARSVALIPDDRVQPRLLNNKG